MVSASDRQAMIFCLSGGQAHDAPEGRVLLESWGRPGTNAPLAMDRAFEGDKTCGIVETLGMTPVVPRSVSRFLVKRLRCCKPSNRGRVRFMFVGLSRFHALACNVRSA